MAVPANLAPSVDLVIRFLRMARDLKLRCQEFNTRAAAGSIPATAILELLGLLRDARAMIDTLPNTTAFRDKAQEFLSDGGYAGDIRADGAALRAAVQAAGAAIAASAATVWTGYTIDATTWAEQQPQRSPAQTATLRGLLDTVISAIG